MTIKITMGVKNGKCFSKKLSVEESEALYNKVLGDEINGELINLTGVKLKITGGSDYTGVPMRKDISGMNRKQILTKKSIGFKGKNRGKKFGGLRVKKTMAGNTIYNKTHQVNFICVKGDAILEKEFAKTEEKEKPVEEEKIEEKEKPVEEKEKPVEEEKKTE